MALDKIYCICEQAKQTRFLSGCKLQRLRRNRIWKQKGSVAKEHWPSRPHPSGRRAGKERALPHVQLAAPHPLPHPHFLLMRRRGAVKRDIGGVLVVERRFEGQSLGFSLICGRQLASLPPRCWYTKTPVNVSKSLI